MKTIKQKLASRGFVGGVTTYGGFWGKKDAEPYDVGKDHFTPHFRDVYVSNRMGGKNYGDGTVAVFYYVTSSIRGVMRNYRCRHSYETEVGNIFASGKTRHEAVDNFLHNFDNKIYNIRKI